MNQSPAEVLPIPPAATAAEERANIAVHLAREIEAITHDPQRIEDFDDLKVCATTSALVGAVRGTGLRLVRGLAAGEHNRGIVDPRPRPRDYRDLLVRLAGDWQTAFESTPETMRGVESAAGLAAVIAGRYVAGLDDAGLSKLHAAMGFPPEWSRIHATANLVSYLMSVFGHWLRQRQGGG